MKQTDMLEWMNDLDAKYLREAEQPVIRQHKPITRRVTAVIAAAAAAAACMAVGVSAYVRYNQRMVQFGFGTLGEAAISELVTAEPVTKSNGVISATLETVLSDGVQAMLLWTLEPEDKSVPFDWTDFDEHYFSVKRNRFIIGGEEYARHIESGFRFDAQEMQQNQRWEIMYFTLPKDATEEELANAVFETYVDVTENPDGEDYVSGSLFSGLSFDVDLRQNVDAMQMRAEDGTEMTFSAFEFYMDNYAASNNDMWNMNITWKNGETEQITYGEFNGSSWNADTGARTWSEFAVPVNETYSPDDVIYYIDKSNPEDWCGFVNVQDVAAFQLGDRVFYPVT